MLLIVSGYRTSSTDDYRVSYRFPAHGIECRKMRNFIFSFLVFVFLGLGMGAPHAEKKTVAIGYQQIINPWKVAIVDGAFEKATGYKIKWKRFKTGISAVKALAKGDVQIALAGSSPIAAGASYGYDIELFWIAEDTHYAEALVVRNGAGITMPQDLEGKRIGVPFGSTTHFHLLFALEQFKIKKSDVKILNMPPDVILAAWNRQEIDATFVWFPVLGKIRGSGKVLMSSGQLNRWGKATFDGIVANRIWAKNNPDFMVNFVKTIAAADASYRDNSNAWTSGSEPVRKISVLLGEIPSMVSKAIRYYKFPPPEEQMSTDWLSGGSTSGAAKALLYTSNFLKDQKLIGKVLPDYGDNVNDRWLRMAFDR